MITPVGVATMVILGTAGLLLRCWGDHLYAWMIICDNDLLKICSIELWIAGTYLLYDDLKVNT